MTAFYVALSFIAGALARDVTVAWLVAHGHAVVHLRRKPEPRTKREQS